MNIGLIMNSVIKLTFTSSPWMYNVMATSVIASCRAKFKTSQSALAK